MSQAIITEILIIVQQWTNIIIQRVQGKWANMSAIPGETRIDSATVSTGSMILSSIFAGGMKAFICEHGSGSLLDRDNPDLAEYIHSDLFNNYRAANDYKITGRDEGTYSDIDGNSHSSSGSRAGRIIESSRPDSDFRAWEPSHVIQEEINLAVSEIETEIFEAVGNILLDSIVLKFPKSMTL